MKGIKKVISYICLECNLPYDTEKEALNCCDTSHKQKNCKHELAYGLDVDSTGNFEDREETLKVFALCALCDYKEERGIDIEMFNQDNQKWVKKLFEKTRPTLVGNIW